MLKPSSTGDVNDDLLSRGASSFTVEHNRHRSKRREKRNKETEKKRKIEKLRNREIEKQRNREIEKRRIGRKKQRTLEKLPTEETVERENV